MVPIWLTYPVPPRFRNCRIIANPHRSFTFKIVWSFLQHLISSDLMSFHLRTYYFLLTLILGFSFLSLALGQTAPKCPSGNLPPLVSNFGKPHTAHAVTGGPYVVTDFARTGKVKVALNGLQSHSHGTINSGPVTITNWIWSWTDPQNPAADYWYW